MKWVVLIPAHQSPVLLTRIPPSALLVIPVESAKSQQKNLPDRLQTWSQHLRVWRCSYLLLITETTKDHRPGRIRLSWHGRAEKKLHIWPLGWVQLGTQLKQNRERERDLYTLNVSPHALPFVIIIIAIHRLHFAHCCCYWGNWAKSLRPQRAALQLQTFSTTWCGNNITSCLKPTKQAGKPTPATVIYIFHAKLEHLCRHTRTP